MSDLLKIHALADGQLEGSDREAAQKQLNECPHSKAEFEAVVALKGALKSHVQGVDCEETWAKCRGRLDELDRSQRVESFVGRYAWGICGAFLVFIAGAAVLNRLNPNSTLKLHEVSSATRNLSSASINPGSIGSWLLKELGGKAPVRLEDQGPIQVVAQRAGIDPEGRRVVQLQMQDGKGPLVLVLVTNTDAIEGEGSGSTTHGQIDNANCITWVDGRVACLLIGQRSHEELEAISERLKL